jgi:hypothetical protein
MIKSQRSSHSGDRRAAESLEQPPKAPSERFAVLDDWPELIPISLEEVHLAKNLLFSQITTLDGDGQWHAARYRLRR